MATLVKQSSRYYLQFYNANRSPKRKRVALKTSRKRPARSKQRELEDAYLEGRFDPWHDDPFTYDKPFEPLTLSEAVERFLKIKREAGRRESTLSSYRWKLKLLMEQVGTERSMDAITRREVAAFVHEPSVRPASRCSRYRHLRAFLRYAVKEGWASRNPLEKIEAPEQGEKLPKHVTRSELDRICSEVRKDYRQKRAAGACKKGELIWRVHLFRFAFTTGMRRSELARLKWEDIDFERSLIYIRKQKNKKEQTIPLIEAAQSVLEEIRRGAPSEYVFGYQPKGGKRDIPAFGRNQSRMFRQYREQAGIERPVTFHGLRHGFATCLAEAGKPAHIIKEACRHADISTSMRYVHLANDHVKEELEDVFR